MYGRLTYFLLLKKCASFILKNIFLSKPGHVQVRAIFGSCWTIFLSEPGPKKMLGLKKKTFLYLCWAISLAKIGLKKIGLKFFKKRSFSNWARPGHIPTRAQLEKILGFWPWRGGVKWCGGRKVQVALGPRVGAKPRGGAGCEHHYGWVGWWGTKWQGAAGLGFDVNKKRREMEKTKEEKSVNILQPGLGLCLGQIGQSQRKTQTQSKN